MITEVTEDYVSFEIAKLLKEKGFKEITQGYINTDREVYMLPFQQGVYELSDKQYPYPTLQMAMKWLRDTYKLCIVIEPIITDDDGSAGCLWRFSISKLLELQYKSEFIYECYEVACEAAIKYCLTNLI